MGIDFSKIKLVIWDLDETLWKGILSEGTMQPVESNNQLIRNMTDAGVVNSICSKNDPNEVDKALKEMGLEDYFVFKSVNWTSKGSRVKQIISEMNLRAANVLFIDDNTTNLGEVESCCPSIMTATEEVIPELARFYSEVQKKDTEHKRLKQYKIIEKKAEFRATEASNLEFLKKCGIRVDIRFDCMAFIDRIEELIQRANQLNFTKVRSKREEICELIKNPLVKSGIVEVKDRFGDYGIVGFFAVRNNKLLHFVFSCRTLNMGVEQYVYHHLGRPEIDVVGEVSSNLDGSCPDWINSEDVDGRDKKLSTKHKIVVKGPCDLQQIFSFIKDSKNIIAEFSYVNDRGVLIEQGNHTAHIVECLTLSEEQKDYLVKTLPFGDQGMFETRIYDQDVRAVVLSMFTDPNLGLYQEKKSKAVVAFGEFTNDLTKKENWEKVLAGEVFTANCRFTEPELRSISENYTFLERIKVPEIVRNLDFIREHIDKDSLLVLCLGSETAYDNNRQAAYNDRHVFHAELNQAIRTWSKDKSNVALLDVNKYIHSQQDYTNNINHFQKHIYYWLSTELISIIEQYTSEKLTLATKTEMVTKRALNILRKVPHKIVRIFSRK